MYSVCQNYLLDPITYRIYLSVRWGAGILGRGILTAMVTFEPEYGIIYH